MPRKTEVNGHQKPSNFPDHSQTPSFQSIGLVELTPHEHVKKSKGIARPRQRDRIEREKGEQNSTFIFNEMTLTAFISFFQEQRYQFVIHGPKIREPHSERHLRSRRPLHASSHIRLHESSIPYRPDLCQALGSIF